MVMQHTVSLGSTNSVLTSYFDDLFLGREADNIWRLSSVVYADTKKGKLWMVFSLLYFPSIFCQSCFKMILILICVHNSAFYFEKISLPFVCVFMHILVNSAHL